MNLSFYESLSPVQKSYADRIAARAREIGLPPELAVAIAYQESRLNPAVGVGSAGEIGIMQIKPATAREMGYTLEDIKDPIKNYEAGLAYLKKSYELSQGDARLAAAGYNAGVNHEFFTPKGTKLPDQTIRYLGDLKQYGTFQATPTQPEREQPTSPGEPTPDQISEGKARTLGEIGGAVVGTGVAARRRAMDLARAGGRKTAGMIAAEVARQLPQPPPVDDAMQTRILQGTTDPTSGTTGRARMGGFNIETAQQSARAKEAAENIGALQRAGLVSQSAPSVLAQAPGMTASPSGVIIPRSSPPSAPPPPRGALEEVSSLFRSMMGPETRLGSLGRAAMRYGAPPLALYQTGSELGALSSQLNRENIDYGKAIPTAVGALGAFGSMFPATAPIAIPMAIAGPLMSSAVETGRTRPLGQMGDVVAP